MSKFLTSSALALMVGLLVISAAQAQAPTAYYTLNDLTTGIQNQGSDGSTSDLNVFGSGITAASSSIIGGGALNFDGTSILRVQGGGNAAQDLTGFPATISTWVRSSGGSNRDSVVNLADFSAGDAYLQVGVQPSNSPVEAELVLRNSPGGFNDLDAAGSVTDDGAWHNVVAVFDTGNTQRIYFDGKLAGTGNDSEAIPAGLDQIALGGFFRNSNTGSVTDPFNGDMDDTGIFSAALDAADVALINGLGQLGGTGLDQFEEAQALEAATIGETAMIDGQLWERVDGLAGVTGDFGGTIANGDAFIVTSDTGLGIQLAAVPEPATLAIWSLMALGLAAFGWFRKKRSS